MGVDPIYSLNHSAPPRALSKSSGTRLVAVKLFANTLLKGCQLGITSGVEIDRDICGTTRKQQNTFCEARTGEHATDACTRCLISTAVPCPLLMGGCNVRGSEKIMYSANLPCVNNEMPDIAKINIHEGRGHQELEQQA